MKDATCIDPFDVIEATWPAARRFDLAGWTIRDGKGGGKRASSASLVGPFVDQKIETAETAMAKINHPALFMIRPGEDALDAALAERGYRITDRVVIYSCPLAVLTRQRPERLAAFSVWPPLSIMEEIWTDGDVGPARIELMHRVKGPKSAILARINDRAAGAAFVAIHNNSAMLHALEVVSAHRRQGVAVNIMGMAAQWAQDQGANRLFVVVTAVNEHANALYASLNMSVVGHYHYRLKTAQGAEQA